MSKREKVTPPPLSSSSVPNIGLQPEGGTTWRSAVSVSSGVDGSTTATSESAAYRKKNMPEELSFARHATVGCTHCDGQGQVWCDGNRTGTSHADLLRPLSPSSSTVAVKTLLSNVTRLEDFEHEAIGKGFFSDVYKVRHKKTGQVLVLKMNNEQCNIASIIQEIQLLKKLHHPNIIKLVGVCVHDSNIHGLIEYMNGGDLSKLLLNEEIYLSWQVRMGLAKDIASGMNYLHMHCIIHRDLTSLNCLVKKNANGTMNAVVADLGLATGIPRDKSEKLVTVGTPFWMSPENLKGKFYTEKTDLFSFGIIMCEIIARVTANPDELPRLNNFGLDVVSFRSLCGDCPEKLLCIAFSCCDIEPTMRPAFSEVVLGIRIIEAGNEEGTKRSPQFTGRMRSQSTVVNPMDEEAPRPHHHHQPTKSPRNSIIRSNSDSGGSRPGKLPSVSKKWVNPFDTPRLKNGRTKLTEEMSTALSDLPPEIFESFQKMCLAEEEEDDENEGEGAAEDPTMRKRSKSLPNSPVTHRWRQQHHSQQQQPQHQQQQQQQRRPLVDENTNICKYREEEIVRDIRDRRNTLSPGFMPPSMQRDRSGPQTRTRSAGPPGIPRDDKVDSLKHTQIIDIPTT